MRLALEGEEPQRKFPVWLLCLKYSFDRECKVGSGHLDFVLFIQCMVFFLIFIFRFQRRSGTAYERNACSYAEMLVDVVRERKVDIYP